MLTAATPYCPKAVRSEEGFHELSQIISLVSFLKAKIISGVAPASSAAASQFPLVEPEYWPSRYRENGVTVTVVV